MAIAKQFQSVGFVKGPQATRADLHLFGLAAHRDGESLNVWQPLPVGSALGMAYIMPKLRSLATYLTFGHSCTPFSERTYRSAGFASKIACMIP